MPCLRYMCGIGKPYTFKVEYEPDKKRLVGYRNRFKIPFCCKVITSDLKLKAYFLVSNGDLCGFIYECDLDTVPRKSLNEEYAPDGFVKLRKHKDAAYTSNFIEIKGRSVFYDEEKKLLAIGDMDCEVTSFKVCDNLIISVNEQNRVVRFTVKL